MAGLKGINILHEHDTDDDDDDENNGRGHSG